MDYSRKLEQLKVAILNQLGGPTPASFNQEFQTNRLENLLQWWLSGARLSCEPTVNLKTMTPLWQTAKSAVLFHFS